MAGARLNPDFWINEYISSWDYYAHGVDRVLVHLKTQYQDMYIVESGSYGKALILDGKWQSSTVDEFLYHEPLVHTPMICHGLPKRVLVLGGGEGATVREVLRWRTVEQVTMVDIDGEVVSACRQHLPEMHQRSLDDPRVQLVIGDALKFLDETEPQSWDVVISDLTDPIEHGPAYQLFTQEHYQQVQRALAPNGWLMLQAGSITPMDIHIHGRLARTLQTVFPTVQSCVCPASSYGLTLSYLLASQQPLPRFSEVAVVDQLLAKQVIGELRMMDGVALVGLLNPPLHLRQAAAKATQIYTLANPPKPTGQGSMGQRPDS